jgi:hypothetical protein
MARSGRPAEPGPEGRDPGAIRRVATGGLGPGRSTAVVVVALLAVVGFAIGGAFLGSGRAPGVLRRAAIAPSGSSSAVVSAPAATAGLGAPSVEASVLGLNNMAPGELIASLNTGSLEGRVVMVTGRLVPAQSSCPDDARTPCTRYHLLGLDGVPVTWVGPPILPAALAPGQPAPATMVMVVVPRGPGLELLGQVAGELDHPRSPDTLPRGSGLSAPSHVVAVAGWLVTNGLRPCQLTAVPASPCPQLGPVLVHVAPTADRRLTTDRPLEVAVEPGAPGMTVGAAPLKGPFLVRWRPAASCDPAGAGAAGCAETAVAAWQIVARFDPLDVVGVVTP